MIRWLPVLVLAACAPSLDTSVARHGPALAPALDRLPAIAEHAEHFPLVASPGIVAHDPPMRPEMRESPTDNLAIMYLDDLRSFPDLGNLGSFSREPSRLSRCGALMRFGREPDGPREGDFVEYRHLCKERAPILLESCASFEYLAVVRMHEFIEPVETPGRFTTGVIRGDVLLYRLVDAALLGGFPISVENSPVLDYSTDPDRDLRRKLQSQLDDALVRHVHPGSP